MTLVGVVCRACNDYFGQEIDPSLSLEGMFGYMRLLHNHKPASELNSFRAETLPLTVVGDSLMAGSSITLDNHDGIVQGRPADTIVFRDANGLTLKLTEQHVSSLASLNELRLTPPVQITIISPTSEERIRIDRLLREKGAQIEQWQDTSSDTYQVIAKVELNNTRLRALVKIALNYAAFAYRKIHPALTSFPEFDSARKFARYGTIPNYQMVQIGKKLNGICKGKDIGDLAGHALGVGFALDRQTSISVNLSLYGLTSQTIVLCRDYRGLILNSQGHFMDFETKTVYPLTLIDL